MTLDRHLLSLLVCPVCKSALELRRDAESRPIELVCHADRLAFPIRDGIPVMLESEARSLADPAAAPAPAAQMPGQANGAA
jgi:uncharacterized protein YbaR (Trm112 family)